MTSLKTIFFRPSYRMVRIKNLLWNKNTSFLMRHLGLKNLRRNDIIPMKNLKSVWNHPCQRYVCKLPTNLFITTFITSLLSEDHMVNMGHQWLYQIRMRLRKPKSIRVGSVRVSTNMFVIWFLCIDNLVIEEKMLAVNWNIKNHFLTTQLSLYSTTKHGALY